MNEITLPVDNEPATGGNMPGHSCLQRSDLCKYCIQNALADQLRGSNYLGATPCCFELASVPHHQYQVF